MAVEEKSEAQWRREGWTDEEIRTFSKLGLVLCNTGEDALTDAQRELIAGEAYDRGHSAGEAEVEMYRKSITEFVLKVIEAGEA